MSDWRTALFNPRRVAVVGASATPGKAGALFLSNLASAESGFVGDVIGIHPSATELLGRPTFPRLDAAPAPVDLAIVVTPAASLPSVIEDCGRASIPVAVVISGGFAETGAEGALLQQRAIEAARTHRVRLVGPNCFGVINAHCGLNASLSIGLPRKGGISLVTQSGAYGMAAYSRSIDEGMGFSKIVALGNKADVDEADIIAYLGSDPETRVIALLLESFRDGRRLFETIAAITSSKPVVALKTGRNPSAQRAAASHTAALSSDSVVAEAALCQAGAHVVDDGFSLLEVAASLARQPPLRGRRIAIITNSGGVGVELTDLLESHGLAVPELSPELQQKIAQTLPPHGSPANPVDVTTDWARFPQMYGAAVEALMRSDEVDAVVPVLLQRSALMPEVGDAVAVALRKSRDAGSQKPLHVCWVAPRSADANRARLLEAGIPCHLWPAGTASALAATTARAADAQPNTIAAPSAAPAQCDADGWAPAPQAFSLLAQAGFPIAPFVVVSSVEEAAAAAEQMGFPVVLKAERPGLVHKSDQGAVRLGLADRDSVARAFTDFSQRLGPGPALLQRQAKPGLELVIGGRRDPSFGPMVLAGLGGVWIEAFNDIGVRLAPIDIDEAARMIEKLKGRRLFEGFRGAPPIDILMFARLLADVSQWFAAASWLDELDINPLIASGDGFKIVDVRMRIRNAEGDPHA
ncbi:acetate--CoA ligase family protein [Methylocystis iwaonis]|uniref:acetate--CoA ligase family protein n=1 Tax=Methylocystis iwaonis TaxID=2885079 RepID=UPI002E7C268D|nr:acetate--CoA ligase family protein [Methylocystis iwaonis]